MSIEQLTLKRQVNINQLEVIIQKGNYTGPMRNCSTRERL